MMNEKTGDAWEMIVIHFEGQKPGKDEIRAYMMELNVELMIDVDIDDDLVNTVFNIFTKGEKVMPLNINIERALKRARKYNRLILR